jgi:UDP-N-acetyl-D-mannosaminuronic acid dehydrogenase
LIEAELCKVLENTYRDVNIAFANEVSLIAMQENLSAKKLIYLANLHPRVSILNPGLGVGGHCIPVDPWFMIERYNNSNSLIKKARNINDAVPHLVISKLLELIDRDSSKNILLLGKTYKPNVIDLRKSPAILIGNELALENSINILHIDPLIEEVDFKKEILNNWDMIILLVEHEILLEFLESKNINYINAAQWYEYR